LKAKGTHRLDISDDSWGSSWVQPIRNSYDRTVRSWTQPGRAQDDYEFNRSIEQMMNAYEQLPRNAPVWVKNILLDELRLAVESMTGRPVQISPPTTKRPKGQYKLRGI